MVMLYIDPNPNSYLKNLRARLVRGIGIRIPKTCNSLFGCTKTGLEYEGKMEYVFHFWSKKGVLQFHQNRWYWNTYSYSIFLFFRKHKFWGPRIPIKYSLNQTKHRNTFYSRIRIPEYVFLFRSPNGPLVNSILTLILSFRDLVLVQCLPRSSLFCPCL